MRRGLAIFIALTCVLAGVAYVLWPSPCPIKINLVSIEPLEMVNDNGADLCWVTLEASNCCTVPLAFFEKETLAQAKVGTKWVDAQQALLPAGIGVRSPGEFRLLLPSTADACRLRLCFSYQHETLKYALGIGMMYAPTRRALKIQQTVKKVSPPLFNHIWRSNSPPDRFYAHSRRHMVTTPELSLRPGQVPLAFQK